MAEHARRLLFVAILNAVSLYGAKSSKFEIGLLLVAWQLLSFATPVKRYANRLRAKFSEHAKALVASKVQAVYAYSHDETTDMWKVSDKLDSLSNSVQLLMSAVGTTLAELVNVWLIASKIGWHVLVPVFIALVHWLLSEAVYKKTRQMSKQSKVIKPPRFQDRINPLLQNTRTVKFYAWEEAFRNVHSYYDCKGYVPPVFWRVLRYGLDLLGCATAEISAAFAITSYIGMAGTIDYSEIALLVDSIQSLTAFTLVIAGLSE
ncbi:hypothetical protein EV174_006152, partial [Coemansia sp. RSA 2320]